MPNVEEIADGWDNNYGAFSETVVEKCFFPKLKRVGTNAFFKCNIKFINDQSFPALQVIGDSGFAGC